ncbi:MAG: xanthine phosphoribosyltransferase, partial [Clostridia bacterium]|nr:xanthine phosphoribosyltransferase [Clostridia bacterium]
GSRVLIIDDFLADGEAVKGMMSLCEQQKAQVVGVGIAVEKGFQPGGQKLREAGVHLKSLAIVEEIRDGKLILRAE